MATFSTLQHYPFLQMIVNMPPDKTTIIYQSLPSVMFTLNTLDQSAKDLISYMLTVTALDVENMIPSQSSAKVREIVKLLTEIKVAYIKDGLITLCPNFRRSFLYVISQRQRHTTKLKRMKEGEKMKKYSVNDLFKKGNERWDAVLKYLISNSNVDNSVSGITINMLKELKFVNQIEGGSSEITSKGFQFLLQGRHVQIWDYLSAFLISLSKTNPDQAPDIIDLFCSLVMLAPSIPSSSSKSSYFVKNNDLKLEVPYKIPKFDHDVVQEFFLHMRELGFIYIKKRKDGYFHVTPNLSMLSSCGSTAIDSIIQLTKTDGYLIVESNYKVYAYTNDELQLAILNTFTEPDGAFADMVMAVITRNSVRRSLEFGITAAQIVAFMRSNSHPLAVEKFGMAGSVPQTVIDQIQLWELERYRFNHAPGVMYSSFASRNEFIAAVEQAKKLKALLWSSAEAKALIVSEEENEDFKHWYGALKQRQNR